MEQPEVIRFLSLNELTSKPFLNELESVSGDAAPALATMTKWRSPLKKGEQSCVTTLDLDSP
jgi:hypothetical protein